MGDREKPPSEPGAFRSVLAIRDYRLLLAGLSTSSAGDWLYGVALVVFVFDQTHSPAWVATASILRLLPYVLFGTLGGALADRLDRKRLMIASDLIRAALMFLLAATAAASMPVAIAISIAFIATAAGTPYGPATSSMMPAVVGETKLAAANALISSVEHGALIAGPALAALLLAIATPAVAFVVNGVSFLVSAACVSLIAYRSSPQRAAESKMSARIREGLRTIYASRTIGVIVVFVVAASFMYGQELVFLVLVAEELIDAGSEGVGFMNAAIGLGGVLATSLVGRLLRSSRSKQALIMAILLSSVPYAALAFVRVPLVAYALMVLVGGGSIILHVTSETMLQRSIDKDSMATIFGVLDSLAVAGMLVGSVVAPLLISLFGVTTALVVSGSIMPLLLVVSLPVLRGMDRAFDEPSGDLALVISGLSRSELLTGTPPQLLEALARLAEPMDVPDGEVVVAEGDQADAVYVVIDGELDVVMEGANKERVNVMRAGQHFGEIGIVEGIPRTASVIARGPVRLIEIKGEDFLALVNQHPPLTRTILDGVAGRLARTHPTYRVGDLSSAKA